MAESKRSPDQSSGTVHAQGDVVGRAKVVQPPSSAPAHAKKDSHSRGSKPVKILFLAANPQDSVRLRLDEEIRGIKQALLQAEYRDKFAIEQEWAVRVSDLQGHLLHHKPDIVHFSGHGNEASEIVLEDDDGNSHEVPAQALSKLFEIFKDNIRCVVLNACFSEKQAQAIAQHSDCVVGMSKAIGDEAAIRFATAFYQALGYGKDVKTAFDLGCLQIHLENLKEQDTPKLLSLKTNTQKIVFVNDEEDIFMANPKINHHSGGVNISGGSVHIGGDVVGRDKITTVTTGLSGDQLNQLFVPLMSALRTAPPEKQNEAMQKAEELKREVAKGKEANDKVMAKIVEGLVGLVPSAIGAVVGMFATPILGGIAGSVTQYVLGKIQGK